MSKTIRIKYVGAKESEDAFRDRTGLMWFQGSVHDVDAQHATHMLKHPDVFARADDAEANAPHSAPVAIGRADGKPTRAQAEQAMVLLAAIGLAVVDPAEVAAGVLESLNGVTLTAPVGLTAAPAPAGGGEGFGQNDAAAGPAAASVSETQANAAAGAGLTLAAGATVGSAPAPTTTPAPTDAPTSAPAAAKTSTKAKAK